MLPTVVVSPMLPLGAENLFVNSQTLDCCRQHVLFPRQVLCLLHYGTGQGRKLTGSALPKVVAICRVELASNSSSQCSATHALRTFVRVARVRTRAAGRLNAGLSSQNIEVKNSALLQSASHFIDSSQQDSGSMPWPSMTRSARSN